MLPHGPGEAQPPADVAGAAAASRGPARRRKGFGTPFPQWARIVIATVLLITTVATVVTHGLLALWKTRTRLEVDAAHVAAAGAAYLPDAPLSAAQAAVRSAALRGVRPQEIIRVGCAPDLMSFSVTLRRSAPSLMLRVLRSAGVDVTATVKARPDGVRLRDPDGAPMVLSGLQGFLVLYPTRFRGGRQPVSSAFVRIA